MEICIARIAPYFLCQLIDDIYIEGLVQRGGVHNIEQYHTRNPVRCIQIKSLNDERAPVMADHNHCVDTFVVKNLEEVLSHVFEIVCREVFWLRRLPDAEVVRNNDAVFGSKKVCGYKCQAV